MTKTYPPGLTAGLVDEVPRQDGGVVPVQLSGPAVAPLQEKQTAVGRTQSRARRSFVTIAERLLNAADGTIDGRGPSIAGVLTIGACTKYQQI